MNPWLEATEHYQQALRAGRKTHRQNVQQGHYPYLQVLDEILTNGMTAGEYNLGLIEIPTYSIVGTKNAGRTNAFASDFMPLLPADSEFGTKWSKLCAAHLSDEGIRDPIICYEYLGRFYVLEGNKRVSVLKYFDAGTILGEVIRILPGESDEPEVLAYQEFLSYYPLTKLYQVHFTRLGSFQKLQLALGYEPEHAWSDEERRDFMSGYYAFETVFRKLGGDALEATAADALLEWLKIYSFDQLQTDQPAELTRKLETIWPDIKAIGQPAAIELDMECEACEDNKGLLNLLNFSILPSHLNIAFIHELSPEKSIWVYAHEAGRRYLEEVMGDSVTVQCFENVGCGAEAETAMETAIANGAEVLFTTTPSLIAACRKIAARHPETKVFNCSIEMPYADVRTYYGRIYEGKFISGAIAGAISKTDDIGYIANYPIFGVPAGINAFALGAQLTNPNAKIHLRWACVEGDYLQELKDLGAEVISTLDIPMPGWNEGQWGTFRLQEDGSSELIASPYWDWGTFYVQFARSILGSWDSPLFGKPERRPVNYWWGMSCGVIDVEWTDAIHAGTRALAEMLKKGIMDGTIDPFRRKILSQDGTVRNDGSMTLTPEEILKMDWLCDNVEGEIPQYEELTDKARALVQLQGIYRDSVPLQKESVLI